MSFFARAGVPPRDVDDLAPIPDELKLFARVEGLAGEERALLAPSREKRSPEQHERLRAISEELDRIWVALRERAERLGYERHGG